MDRATADKQNKKRCAVTSGKRVRWRIIFISLSDMYAMNWVRV